MQGDLLRSTGHYCEGRVAEDSIYSVLHRECFNLFPDAMFADLFTDVGRRSVPPKIVAVVMVLQRIEGLSDREKNSSLVAGVASSHLRTTGIGSLLAPSRRKGVRSIWTSEHQHFVVAFLTQHPLCQADVRQLLPRN